MYGTACASAGAPAPLDDDACDPAIRRAHRDIVVVTEEFLQTVSPARGGHIACQDIAPESRRYGDLDATPLLRVPGEIGQCCCLVMKRH